MSERNGFQVRFNNQFCWSFQPQKQRRLITMRNGSCGKVMFSQVSVCPRALYILLAGRPSPPADGYCSGQYASYWNAFLFYDCIWGTWYLLFTRYLLLTVSEIPTHCVRDTWYSLCPRYLLLTVSEILTHCVLRYLVLTASQILGTHCIWDTWYSLHPRYLVLTASEKAKWKRNTANRMNPMTNVVEKNIIWFMG